MPLPSSGSQITATDVNSELGRLLISFSSGSSTVSTINDRITIVGFQRTIPYVNNDVVLYTTNNTVIGGLSNNTSYYIVSANATTFQLSTTAGGSAINITSTGSGTQFFSRATTSFSMNGEKERRIADKTSGTVSFDDFAGKSRTRTFDTGNIISPATLRNDSFFITNFVKYSGNNSYYVPAYRSGDQFNCGSLDIDAYDTTAYANASIQSQPMSVTINFSFDLRYVYTGNTEIAIIPFIRPVGYPATPTDYGNQPDGNHPLSRITSFGQYVDSGNIRTGNLIVSYSLSNAAALGAAGGWSLNTTGQWNTSKIANPSHMISLAMNINLFSTANSTPITINYIRMNGSYSI